MAKTTIELSRESRNSLPKHPAVRQAVLKVKAANLLFPVDERGDEFGDAAGEAIEQCQRALGVCGGPLADEGEAVIHSLVTFN
jgi:hypothetical protein